MTGVKSGNPGRLTLLVGTLVDGTGATPVADAAIVIEGGTIRQAGPAQHVVGARRQSGPPPGHPPPGDPPPGDPRPGDDAAVTFDGAVAVPGFVDAHVHFTLFADGRSYEEMAAESDAMMAFAAARNALVHLRAGVTTARDNGSRNRLGFELKAAIDQGLIPGPRLLVSGRPITKPSGHFHWCNGAAEGQDEIRAAVKCLAAEGADHIKIMASGGGTAGTDPTRASYSVPELACATATAHELGLPGTAHCRAAESMARAIEAGLDCMEHGEFMAPDGARPFDADLAMRLVDSGMYLSPTLQANGWDTIVRLRALRQPGGLTPEQRRILAAAEQDTKITLEHVARLADMGLAERIIAGTDAGCFDFSFGHIDYCLELMVAAGMAPMQALLAATSVAAKACGVADQVGTIEAGKRADIVILGASPLADIRAAADVLAVYKDGKLVS
jgi:imidazolonepropionase-like amidohydrolase